MTPRSCVLFLHFSFLLPHFPFSHPDAPSLSTTPSSSAILSFSTQFSSQNLTIFLLFVHFLRSHNLNFPSFPHFPPHSPNFNSLNPSPHFSLSINSATLRCFPAILSSDSTSSQLKLHFAPIFATIPLHFFSLQFHLHWSFKGWASFLLVGDQLVNWYCSY